MLYTLFMFETTSRVIYRVKKYLNGVMEVMSKRGTCTKVYFISNFLCLSI